MALRYCRGPLKDGFMHRTICPRQALWSISGQWSDEFQTGTVRTRTPVTSMDCSERAVTPRHCTPYATPIGRRASSSWRGGECRLDKNKAKETRSPF